MSPALWGAATALSWGSADLIGRWTGTRFGAVVALTGTMLTSVVVLGALLLAEGRPLLADPAHLTVPLLAGVANAVGTLCLILALVRGPIVVTSPITASYPMVNLLLGVLEGAVPSTAEWGAIALVMAGVVLVARGAAPAGQGESAAADRRRLLASVAIALASALGFALSIHGIQMVSAEQGELQATFLMRVGGTLTALAILLALPRTRRGVPARWWPLLSLQGLLDGGAYVLLLHGSVGEGAQIAVVVAATYCVVPVLFGRFVLRERMGWPQVAGLVAIVAGVAYLAGAH